MVILARMVSGALLDFMLIYLSVSEFKILSTVLGTVALEKPGKFVVTRAPTMAAYLGLYMTSLASCAGFRRGIYSRAEFSFAQSTLNRPNLRGLLGSFFPCKYLSPLSSTDMPTVFRRLTTRNLVQRAGTKRAKSLS